MLGPDDDTIPLLSDPLVPGAAPGAAIPPVPALDVPELTEVVGAASAAAAAASAAPAADAAPVTPATGLHEHDADALVERLRGRCLAWLAGDGREQIEARCRDVLAEHSTWLIAQITREVGLAFETELTGWVRAAVREELAAKPASPARDDA